MWKVAKAFKAYLLAIGGAGGERKKQIEGPYRERNRRRFEWRKRESMVMSPFLPFLP